MTNVNPEICEVGAAAFGSPCRSGGRHRAVGSAGRWGLLLDRQFYVSFDTWATLGSIESVRPAFPSTG